MILFVTNFDHMGGGAKVVIEGAKPPLQIALMVFV